MGIWRRGKGEQMGVAPVGGQQNAWEEMATTATLERDQAEKAQLGRERQQRKIIGYFLNGNNDQYLVANDVEVDAGTRADFVREVGRGKITREDEAEMLMRLRGPIDRPERGMGAGAIFEKVAQDPWQLQLLELVAGQGLRDENYNNGASAVARIVNYRGPEADYRTPVGFEQKREEILDYIKPQVDRVSYEKYEESMDALEKSLYGKRFEYYQAFEGLRDEAAELRKVEAPTEKLIRRQETYRLGVEQSREMLRQARVDGDLWYQNGQMRGDYYREVAAMPQNAEFGVVGGPKARPEEVRVSYGSSPDFEQIEGRYGSNSALAGVIQTEVFRSRDGQKNWLFCTDGQGRSYVGGIEVNSPITSTGLRREWIQGGDMVTPLYEYASQANGYGDTEDVNGRYQGMWRYYLSRIPVIREYVGIRRHQYR